MTPRHDYVTPGRDYVTPRHDGGVSFGRFAPSPTGELHLGNLRTALLAWLCARSSGRGFLVRIEDLDRERAVAGCAERQLADLACLGIDWDGEVAYQSQRVELYAAAIDRLSSDGLTYECLCTRREIREAASAPQGKGEGGYPGTCRDLTQGDRSRLVEAGRRPALRLRSEQTSVSIADVLHPGFAGCPDDVVLRRNDGWPAYNLAVVVDDAEQDIDQVVRGDDLLTATPAQVHLAQLLGFEPPSYLHVPLAVNTSGQRLAKRDGAVTLSDLGSLGVPPSAVLARIGASLNLAEYDEVVTSAELLARFDLTTLPRQPWTVDG